MAKASRMASRDSNVPKSPARARSTSGPRRGQRAVGIDEREHADQAVLVEVVVRDDVDAGETSRCSSTRGRRSGPRGRRAARAASGCPASARASAPWRARRAVDHDVGPVTELGVRHEPQGSTAATVAADTAFHKPLLVEFDTRPLERCPLIDDSRSPYVRPRCAREGPPTHSRRGSPDRRPRPAARRRPAPTCWRWSIG